jgi:hypothetical protein
MRRDCFYLLLATILTISPALTYADSSEAGFRIDGEFSSPNAFLTAAQQFHPSREPGYMAFLFTVRDVSQLDDPQYGRPVIPDKISSADLLWQDANNAVAFLEATPRTQGTPSKIGILFCLSRAGNGTWRITDSLSFVAYGQESNLQCIQSLFAPHQENPHPYFTLTRTEGGRQYNWSISVSYMLIDNRLRVVQ